MKRSIIAFSLWLISVPVAVQLSSAPAPGKTLRKTPPRVPQLTPVDCKLTLSFFRDNYRTCTQLPTDNANYKVRDGAPSLSAATQDNYYCKITVEPNAPQANWTASTYRFTWTKRGTYMTIKVPKEVTSKITVSFYEDCNNCMDNVRGRPLFRYVSVLQPAQPYCDAFLQYSLKTPC